MNKIALPIVTASLLLVSVGLATAQTTTSTTTWTTDQGTVIREYSTTKNYSTFSDPNLKPNVGLVLPGNVTLYPLPETIKVSNPDLYSYALVNGHAVVVDRATRTVVHTWE